MPCPERDSSPPFISPHILAPTLTRDDFACRNTSLCPGFSPSRAPGRGDPIGTFLYLKKKRVFFPLLRHPGLLSPQAELLGHLAAAGTPALLCFLWEFQLHWLKRRFPLKIGVSPAPSRATVMSPIREGGDVGGPNPGGQTGQSTPCPDSRVWANDLH